MPESAGRGEGETEDDGKLTLELRAAMSMARLWRDPGKPQQARELLALVH
jgi:hypothetical protein